MNRSKLVTLIVSSVAATLFLAASAAIAQQGPSPDRIAKRVDMLKSRLSLTDKQAERIKGILEESQKEAEAQRGKFKGDPQAAAKFRAEHRQATDDKIKAVLNEKQLKEYDKFKDEIRQDRQRMKDSSGKRGNQSRRGARQGTKQGPQEGK